MSEDEPQPRRRSTDRPQMDRRGPAPGRRASDFVRAEDMDLLRKDVDERFDKMMAAHNTHLVDCTSARRRAERSAEALRKTVKTMAESVQDYHQQNSTRLTVLEDQQKALGRLNEDQMAVLEGIATAHRVSLSIAKGLRWLAGIATALLTLFGAWKLFAASGGNVPPLNPPR